MKALTIAAILVLAVGCASADSAEDTLDGPIDTADTEGHPLVPDQYTFYWNTGTCTDSDGNPGVQAYWLADGTIDAAGSLAVTERWFWFFGEPDYDGDCVDTFSLTGVPDESETEPSALGCSICDQVYSIQRVLVDDGCARDYQARFGVSPDADMDGVDDEQSTDAQLLLYATSTDDDSTTDSDMLVVYAEERETGGYMSDSSYGSGTATFQTDGSGTISWLGSRCIVE